VEAQREIALTQTSSDTLSERLTRIEEERAILDTLYTYCTSIDYGERDAFLDCFTPDADWRVIKRLDPASSVHVHGHEALGRFFDSHTHAPEAAHKHITLNTQIHIEGDAAHVTSYVIRVDAREAGPAFIFASGRYLDDLVRDDNGRWRIKSRDCEVDNM
jgi:ketosteroid isomerase-like protein